jgi:hypothetical protein
VSTTYTTETVTWSALRRAAPNIAASTS